MPTEVIDFQCQDFFEIPSRGVTVYTGPSPKDCESREEMSRLLIGSTVRFWDRLWRVNGVESFLIMGPYKAGRPIGISADKLPD